MISFQVVRAYVGVGSCERVIRKQCKSERSWKRYSRVSIIAVHLRVTDFILIYSRERRPSSARLATHRLRARTKAQEARVVKILLQAHISSSDLTISSSLSTFKPCSFFCFFNSFLLIIVRGVIGVIGVNGV